MIFYCIPVTKLEALRRKLIANMRKAHLNKTIHAGELMTIISFLVHIEI
jgi:hypothetical protein